MRRLIERAAGIEPGQAGDHAVSRLWSILDDVGLTDALPWFADLLGLPAEPWAPASELDGAQLREELLQSIMQWLHTLTSRAPLLLIVDDVQWADPTTIDLIARISEARVPRLLLLMTARDGFSLAVAPGRCHGPGAPHVRGAPRARRAACPTAVVWILSTSTRSPPAATASRCSSRSSCARAGARSWSSTPTATSPRRSATSCSPASRCPVPISGSPR